MDIIKPLKNLLDQDKREGNNAGTEEIGEQLEKTEIREKKLETEGTVMPQKEKEKRSQEKAGAFEPKTKELSEKEKTILGAKPPSVTKPVAKSKIQEAIEDILEEGLGEAYEEMPPESQQEFKAKGEETASRIEMLLSKVKIKTQEILELIKKWLLLIPGINKFFLEQEAKIKTDKILKLRK